MRGHATDPSAPIGAVFVFALTVAGIEAASMIAYLAAIGILTASELSLVGRSVVLFAHCLLMIAPALLLLASQLLLHNHISPILTKMEASLARNTNKAMPWAMSLVGMFIVFDCLKVLPSS
jgi:hypothetical protein